MPSFPDPPDDTVVPFFKALLTIVLRPANSAVLMCHKPLFKESVHVRPAKLDDGTMLDIVDKVPAAMSFHVTIHPAECGLP